MLLSSAKDAGQLIGIPAFGKQSKLVDKVLVWSAHAAIAEAVIFVDGRSRPHKGLKQEKQQPNHAQSNEVFFDEHNLGD
jgi:hypothetical protein